MKENLLKLEIENNFIKLSSDCYVFSGGYLNNNSIVILSKTSVFIIDPSYNFDSIKKFLKYNLLKKIIIFTHAHSDHIGNNIHDVFEYADNVLFSEPTEKLILAKYCNSLFFGSNNQINDDEFKKIIFIKDYQRYEECTFYLTPGHSIDSMCILYKNYFIPGDLVFVDCIGRTDFAYSDVNEMRKSLNFIKEIFEQNPKYVVIPGHDGYEEAKNILKKNYYLNFDFIA